MRARVVVGVLAAIGVIAAVAWLVAVPRWRPALERGERLGVEVSNHQGEIDWARAASDGVAFAYVKASEGRDFVDRRFERNRDGAASAGLDVGAYHYFTLCSPGADQAAHFLRVAPPDASAISPAVDLEDLTGPCDPSSATVATELRAFVTAVEQAWGRPLVLYLGADFADRFPTAVSLDRPRWNRRLFFRPDADDWSIWQCTAWGTVAGIDGPVDLDVARARRVGS